MALAALADAAIRIWMATGDQLVYNLKNQTGSGTAVRLNTEQGGRRLQSVSEKAELKGKGCRGVASADAAELHARTPDRPHIEVALVRLHHREGRHAHRVAYWCRQAHDERPRYHGEGLYAFARKGYGGIWRHLLDCH